MEIKVILVLIVFSVFYGFYAINILLPQHRNLKYLISLCFAASGILGWMLSWLHIGWLTTAIVGSALLLLAFISFGIAACLDFIAKVRAKILTRLHS